MRDFRIRFSVATLGAILGGVFAPGAAFGGEGDGQAFNLHPGQELTFAVKVADGKVALGPPRASKLGAAHPRTAR